MQPGQNLQAGFMGNPYQNQYVMNPSPVVAMTTTQLDAMNSNNQAKNIETQITSGFCCYTCLIYFMLIVAILTIIAGIASSKESSDTGAIVVVIIEGLGILIACVLAIMAKSNFDSKKQFIALIIFSIAMALVILAIILGVVAIVTVGNTVVNDVNVAADSYCCIDGDCGYSSACGSIVNDLGSDAVGAIAVIFVVFIGLQLIMNIILVCGARTLHKLMVERDNLLADISAKSNIGGMNRF